jgi:hypothetical protein
MRIFVNLDVSHYFLIPTMRSICVFHQQYLMPFASVICIGTTLLHFFPAWTLYASINSYLWSHNDNICEYGGFTIYSPYTHHKVHFCLPSAIYDGIHHLSSKISIGTCLLNFFPVWTHHSSINSSLWYPNENICQYGGFTIFSYTHQKVRFGLPSAIYPHMPSVLA